MTPQDIITTARYVINDTDSDSYRNSDAELLNYVNDGVKAMAVRLPELFSTVAVHSCTVGVEQEISFANAQALLEVLCITGGRALVPFDFSSLDAFSPTWRAASGAAATQWSRKEGDPVRFFVNPPALAGQQLDVRYSKIPATLALTDSMSEVPATLQPALVDYVVYRTESKDDEHVVTARAQQHYSTFMSYLNRGG